MGGSGTAGGGCVDDEGGVGEGVTAALRKSSRGRNKVARPRAPRRRPVGATRRERDVSEQRFRPKACGASETGW